MKCTIHDLEVMSAKSSRVRLGVDLLQLSFSQMQNDLLLVGIWEIENCVIVVSNCTCKQNFQIVLTNRNPSNSLSSFLVINV